MTNQQHPITPPPELVEQWRDLPEFTDGRRKMIMVTLSREKLLDIATQAARWGADQELEACCADLQMVLGPNQANWLRSVRRPKPPSKEEALDELHISFDRGYLKKEAADIIRRALESLPD